MTDFEGINRIDKGGKFDGNKIKDFRNLKDLEDLPENPNVETIQALPKNQRIGLYQLALANEGYIGLGKQNAGVVNLSDSEKIAAAKVLGIEIDPQTYKVSIPDVEKAMSNSININAVLANNIYNPKFIDKLNEIFNNYIKNDKQAVDTNYMRPRSTSENTDQYHMCLEIANLIESELKDQIPELEAYNMSNVENDCGLAWSLLPNQNHNLNQLTQYALNQQYDLRKNLFMMAFNLTVRPEIWQNQDLREAAFINLNTLLVDYNKAKIQMSPAENNYQWLAQKAEESYFGANPERFGPSVMDIIKDYKPRRKELYNMPRMTLVHNKHVYAVVSLIKGIKPQEGGEESLEVNRNETAFNLANDLFKVNTSSGSIIVDYQLKGDLDKFIRLLPYAVLSILNRPGEDDTDKGMAIGTLKDIYNQLTPEL